MHVRTIKAGLELVVTRRPESGCFTPIAATMARWLLRAGSGSAHGATGCSADFCASVGGALMPTPGRRLFPKPATRVRERPALLLWRDARASPYAPESDRYW